LEEWRSAVADAKGILAGITTMVDETKTMVEDALPLAKKQRPWSETQNRLRRDKTNREAAARALISIGRPAVPPLTAQKEKANSQLSWWIQAVLDEIGRNENEAKDWITTLWHQGIRFPRRLRFSYLQ
jgi:hypothetical protein